MKSNLKRSCGYDPHIKSRCHSKGNPNSLAAGKDKEPANDQNISHPRVESEERCDDCGSTDVLVLRWVNPNTGEISHKESGTEGLQPFCNDCNDTTNLIS